MTCPICEGLLQAPVNRGSLLDAIKPGPWEPCPECLTYPATPDVREVAREWFGLDMWERIPWVSGNHWLEHRCTSDISAEWVRILPLYLPAGRDLAVRVLAKRLGHELRVDPTAPRWEEGLDGWILSTRSRLQGREKRLDFVGREVTDAWHGVVISVPALATIPADAPPDLRTARALALCLAATEPPNDN